MMILNVFMSVLEVDILDLCIMCMMMLKDVLVVLTTVVKEPIKLGMFFIIIVEDVMKIQEERHQT